MAGQSVSGEEASGAATTEVCMRLPEGVFYKDVLYLLSEFEVVADLAGTT